MDKITGQARIAIDLTKDMFDGWEQTLDPDNPPEDISKAEIWSEYCKLKNYTRNGVKPKISTAVQQIVEHPELLNLPINVIADIVRTVFSSYGIESRCSEASVRWYLSKYAQEWKIVPRAAIRAKTNV